MARLIIGGTGGGGGGGGGGGFGAVATQNATDSEVSIRSESIWGGRLSNYKFYTEEGITYREMNARPFVGSFDGSLITELVNANDLSSSYQKQQYVGGNGSSFWATDDVTISGDGSGSLYQHNIGAENIGITLDGNQDVTISFTTPELNIIGLDVPAGTGTATFAATNAPANISPAKWLRIFIGGVPHWIPAFAE